jgi:CPA1 family monovalent cation:H+ antiporter
MLVAFLVIASAVAIAVKWVRLPYSIALVIAGLIIGTSNLLPEVEMTPSLILLVCLPPLLFEASWNTDIGVLRKNWCSVWLLATVGVFISMLAVATIMHFGAGFTIGTALIFGALISATDPISVVALFRKMGLPENLTMVLEGESLLNDGTAVVLFGLVSAATMSGTEISIPTFLANFFVVTVGGTLVGLVCGFAASKLISLLDDHLLETMLTTILAYGAYLIGERLHVSSVIAVVIAGLIFGNYGKTSAMSEKTRFAVTTFWEYAAFVINSLVFLLIGLQIKPALLIEHSQLIAVGVIAILLSRMIVVYGLCPLANKITPVPRKWRHLLVWGALRGSLCMALALSLPEAFLAKEAIIVTTFGTVLFTLLIQGLTTEPLVKLLRIERNGQT